MRWSGKIFGMVIGVLLGHPLWVLVGLVLGHLVDIGFFQRLLTRGLTQGSAHIQRIFFDSTFSVMGYVAKSDGRVSEKEIRAAEQIMQQMSLSPDMRREAIHLFNRGKQPDFDLATTMARLRTACWHHPTLLQTFLQIQVQIANAEGVISPGKREALQAICADLGLRGFMFNQFEQQAHAEQSYQQYYQQSRPDSAQHLNDAYQILNVSKNDNDADITKAYRRLLSQNHPDKLMAKGLPPEMIKLANEKTQKLKSAYETIKAARGMP